MSFRYERLRFNADDKTGPSASRHNHDDGGVPADNEMKAIKEHVLFHNAKPINPFQMKAIMVELLGKRIEQPGLQISDDQSLRGEETANPEFITLLNYSSRSTVLC